MVELKGTRSHPSPSTGDPTEERDPQPGAQAHTRTHIDTWRYIPAGKRDLRVDLLRGFAVFAMVVDHIGGHSWLYALTGGNRFFVSAAEAFVFISGMMVGMVYGSRARRSGLGAVIPTLLQRAWILYVLSVWLAIATALIATIFGLPGAGVLSASPARFILEVVAARRTFYLVDVMLLYFFLVLLSPLALWLLLRGRWWLVVLSSWSLWLAYQFSPEALQLPWPIIANSVFKLASWQVLFFTGLLIGFERDRLARRRATSWPRSPLPLPLSLRGNWLAPLAILFGLMIWLHLTDGAPLGWFTSQDTAALLDRWFDKSALPLARLLACAVVFTLAWIVVTRFWRPVHAAMGWLLLPLGQAALYAYAAHLFLIPAVDIVIVRVWGGQQGTYPFLHPALNTLIQILAILVLWGLTRARFLTSVVAPLGQPPLVAWRPPWPGLRTTLWRPSDALVAVLIVALASALLIPSRPADPAATPAESSEQALSGSSAQDADTSAPLSARPVSTVTAPRKVAGSAKGSAAGNQSAADATAPAPASNPAESDIEANSQPPEPVTGDTPASAGAEVEASGSPAEQVTAGGYLEDSAFSSEALGRDMPYGIYLPPGYNQSDQRYPVLYMLHGSGGHYSEWIGYGLAEIADRMIETGQIPPLIIVVPQGDTSFWVNHLGSDDERWGDHVVHDVVQHVDASYRTLATRESRAIGGLSMGAFGALSLAFTHPDVFGAVGAHSPSLRTPDDAPEVIGGPGEFARVDPVELATEVDPTTLPRIWVDVGDEDEWSMRVNEFHALLRDRAIRHNFLVTPGRHDSDYWTDHIPDYLRFYMSGMATS